MTEYSSVYALSYVFGVERSLTGRVGMRGLSCGGALWERLWPKHSRCHQRQQFIFHKPLTPCTVPPGRTLLTIAIVRARNIRTKLKGNTLQNLRPRYLLLLL